MTSAGEPNVYRRGPASVITIVNWPRSSVSRTLGVECNANFPTSMVLRMLRIWFQSSSVISSSGGGGLDPDLSGARSR